MYSLPGLNLTKSPETCLDCPKMTRRYRITNGKEEAPRLPLDVNMASNGVLILSAIKRGSI